MGRSGLGMGTRGKEGKAKGRPIASFILAEEGEIDADVVGFGGRKLGFIPIY